MEKYILSDVNKLLAGSNLYCEPLDMFILYAKYLYNLLNNISNEDNHAIDELLKQFEVNSIKLSLSRKDTLYVEFQITCLKQYIDYYFAKTVAKDINLLKICKFCNKAFLAVNPKTEYDTPQCKNKANVYKSRSKIRKRQDLNLVVFFYIPLGWMFSTSMPFSCYTPKLKKI